MKKLLEYKALILFLAAGGLVALGLLSAALRDFSFRPAEPLAFNLGGTPSLAPAVPLVEVPLWKLLLFGGLLLLIFIILLILLDPETRKRILLKLFRFVMTMVALWYAMTYAYEHGSLKTLLNLTPASAAAAAVGTGAPVPVYVPPVISPWLVLGVSFLIALALILVGWLIYTRRPAARASFSKHEIAGIAREALKDLQDGQDWENAIVRCYVRMNQVVNAERGLVRQAGATPAEFALRMEKAGLPGEAVQTLTRLFERVRYGGQPSSPAERDLAAAALSAILHDCGVPA
jgi:hypothetical protein